MWLVGVVSRRRVWLVPKWVESMGVVIVLAVFLAAVSLLLCSFLKCFFRSCLCYFCTIYSKRCSKNIQDRSKIEITRIKLIIIIDN